LILLALAATGCSSGTNAMGSDTAATLVAATVFALQTSAAALQTELAASVELPPATPAPTATILPEATPTPQNPLVTQVALCWGGPGKAYVVISSVAAGTRVEMLGVGSLAGWYVIQNPIYHDRCWIEAKNLQIDPAVDLSKLKVFNPPPTPGPKATEVPTPTP
jgi:hypothetical protein